MVNWIYLTPEENFLLFHSSGELLCLSISDASLIQRFIRCVFVLSVPAESTAVWAIQTLCFRGSCSGRSYSQCEPLCTRVCAILIFIAGHKYLSICRFTNCVYSCQQQDEGSVCLFGWKSGWIFFSVEVCDSQYLSRFPLNPRQILTMPVCYSGRTASPHII